MYLAVGDRTRTMADKLKWVHKRVHASEGRVDYAAL